MSIHSLLTKQSSINKNMLPLSPTKSRQTKTIYTHCRRRTIRMVFSSQGTTRLITIRMRTCICPRCLASIWHLAGALGAATFEFQLSLRASTDRWTLVDPLKIISYISCWEGMTYFAKLKVESCKFPILFAGPGPPFLNQQYHSKSIS